MPDAPTKSSWALLILLGMIWGGSFPAVKVALDGFEPLSIAALRITLAAMLVTLIVALTKRRLPGFSTPTDRRIWLHALGVAAFTNALPFALLSWGQQFVTSGFAGISMAVVPLFVLPLAHLTVPGEKLNIFKSLGFLLGFLGVLVLMGQSAFDSSGATSENLARFACIAATACYAIGNIITRLSPPVSQLGFSSASLLLATLLILPTALFVEGLPTFVLSAPSLAVIYLGLVPTALATVIMVRIIRTAGPSFMVLVNFQVPIWAALMGVVFLAEHLPTRFIAALGLILAGLAISRMQRRPLR